MVPKFTPPDDTNVPRIVPSSKTGWSGTVDRLQGPDGKVYVKADARAKADFIHEHKYLGPIRYQLYEHSAVARKERKVQREIKRYEKVQQSRRRAKQEVDV